MRARGVVAGAVAAGVWLACLASPADAQVRRPPREAPSNGSWEIGGGVVWTDAFSGAETAAELTQNSATEGGFDLFKASGRVRNGTGVGGTLGYYLSRSLALEAGVRYSQPRLTYRLSGDFENADAATASETLTRYVFTGSLVWHLRGLAFGRRGAPFLTAGAGYVRDLHDKNELIETGTEYHAGAGVKIWFGTGPRRLGIRGQAGVSITDGGFDFRDEPRTLPMASAALVYLF